MAVTSEFYAADITLFQGFSDPVGPADQGWLAQPNLALCEVEASPSTTFLLNVSDSGYRTRASDPLGVVAYPPRISGPFTADVSVNLDPTQSSVAAAWGSLVLANTDDIYTWGVSNLTTDGQLVTIYRGIKTLDDTRGILVDPPAASLVIVFRGVMGRMVAGHSIITIPLHDASYFLQDQLPRVYYGGTGGADGTAEMTGVSQPLVVGGDWNTMPLANISPQPVDPSNLVYQFTQSSALARTPTAGGGVVEAAYDGGVLLTSDLAPSGGVYAVAPAAGHYNQDWLTGLVRLGSTPVFQLTLDVVQFWSGPTSWLSQTGWNALTEFTTLPVLTYVAGGGTLVVVGVDVAFNVSVAHFPVGRYVAAGEDITGLDLMNDLMSGAGALLVPCRDGLLRVLVLSAIPAATTSVLSLDDSNIVTIEPVALPASVDPSPSRLSLAYNKNWTVQTSLAGAITAAKRAFVSLATRTATSVGVPSLLAVPQHQAATGVIAASAGSPANTLATVQPIVANMIKLWGSPRRRYEITVPASIGLTLDWGSVVTVTSDFDGLDVGKQGQIVGWKYSSEDMTAMFRVLV